MHSWLQNTVAVDLETGLTSNATKVSPTEEKGEKKLNNMEMI